MIPQQSQLYAGCGNLLKQDCLRRNLTYGYFLLKIKIPYLSLAILR